MKELNKNKKIAISLALAAIVVLSTFVVSIQYGLITFDSNNQEGGISLFTKIFVDDKEGLVPHSVNFTAMALHYTGDLEYSWDFGDGETSKEMNPMHTYEESGIYNCKLIVTDDNGETDEDFVKLTVKKNKPPVVTISINENTIERKFIPILHAFPAYAGDKQRVIIMLAKTNPNIFGEGRIVCTAQIDDPENDEIVSYKWTEKSAESAVTRSGDVLQPEHYFESNGSIRIPELYTWMPGRHIVTLTVEDSAGNKANASIDFQVEKSMKKVNRETKLRMIRGVKNFWLVSLNPIVGAALSAALLAVWKYNNFTGIKLITLSILKLLLQVDISDEVLMDQAKVFLEGHPLIQKNFKKTLESAQIFLEKRKPGSPLIETIQNFLEYLDLANHRPILSNPKPENNHDNIDIDLQNVSITATDLEGDSFNISIHGDYINDVSLTNQYNNTFSTTVITPLPYDTEIYWHVNISYAQGRWVNETHMFKTRWN